MFQIVRVEFNRDGQVVARRPLQPLYDLWDDAMALAEFDASRCDGDYGPLPPPQAGEGQGGGWWAFDDGRTYRFVIEHVAATSLAS
ncbi:MAG TPA: hypothetical protein VG291_19905 [Xanthobacteraceae bacterium]|jgi:hypothetical protein|nr:hypothetical protein [Xanthobacteraceae bacterium]